MVAPSKLLLTTLLATTALALPFQDASASTLSPRRHKDDARRLIETLAADQAKKDLLAKDDKIKSLESEIAQVGEDRKADQRMWDMEEKTQQAVEDLKQKLEEGKKAKRDLEPRRGKGDMRKLVDALASETVAKEGKEKDEKIKELEDQLARAEEEREDDKRMWEMEEKTQSQIEALKESVTGNKTE